MWSARIQVSHPDPMQAAAAVIAGSHPQGLDYLVINAAVNDNHVGPALDLCAGNSLTPSA